MTKVGGKEPIVVRKEGNVWKYYLKKGQNEYQAVKLADLQRQFSNKSRCDYYHSKKLCGQDPRDMFCKWKNNRCVRIRGEDTFKIEKIRGYDV